MEISDLNRLISEHNDVIQAAVCYENFPDIRRIHSYLFTLRPIKPYNFPLWRGGCTFYRGSTQQGKTNENNDTWRVLHDAGLNYNNNAHFTRFCSRELKSARNDQGSWNESVRCVTLIDMKGKMKVAYLAKMYEMDIFARVVSPNPEDDLQ